LSITVVSRQELPPISRRTVEDKFISILTSKGTFPAVGQSVTSVDDTWVHPVILRIEGPAGTRFKLSVPFTTHAFGPWPAVMVKDMLKPLDELTPHENVEEDVN